MSHVEFVPPIGVLGFEAGHEEAFPQFEELLGHIANPKTFNFPVRYERVKGICYTTLVTDPTPHTCELMISTAQQLEKDGCRAIVSCCGFTSRFQRELATSVKIPVFASSLLLIPMIAQALGSQQSIGVITFDKRNFTELHLKASGVTDDVTVWVAGLEDTDELSKIWFNPNASFDTQQFGKDLVQVVQALVKEHPDIGAVVLECGDLPPFAAMIREAVNLPVLDLVTAVNMAYEIVALDRWNGL